MIYERIEKEKKWEKKKNKNDIGKDQPSVKRGKESEEIEIWNERDE